MIASTPPTYAIGTAVLVTVYRGGHATAPKRHPRIVISAGSFSAALPKPAKGCRVTYSKISPAGRRLGFRWMRTDWCSA